MVEIIMFICQLAVQSVTSLVWFSCHADDYLNKRSVDVYECLSAFNLSNIFDAFRCLVLPFGAKRINIPWGSGCLSC